MELVICLLTTAGNYLLGVVSTPPSAIYLMHLLQYMILSLSRFYGVYLLMIKRTRRSSVAKDR
jgi:hypothetical protein